MRFTIAAIIAGAGLVSAQNISSGCQTTLTNILANPDAACLNPSALVSVVIGQKSNTSIISPVDTWINGLCSQAPCSNATLSAVVTNVTSGCSTELSALGASTSSSSVSQLISTVQEAYPAVRQIVCLKDTSAGELCVTELLTDIQNSVGTLSVSNIVQIIPNIISGSATIPSNVTCSDCVKQAYNIANTQLSSLVGGSLSSAVGTSCGASFTNGATPSEITEIASTASASTSGSSSGAVSLFSFSSAVAVAIVGLITVSSAITVLA